MALVDHAKINGARVEIDLKVFFNFVLYAYLVSISMVQIGNHFEPNVCDDETDVKDDI